MDNSERFATERSSLLPDVPSCNELMPEYDVISPSDRGFASLPAGVEQAVYDRWVRAMDNCINNPGFIEENDRAGTGSQLHRRRGYGLHSEEQEANGEVFRYSRMIQIVSDERGGLIPRNYSRFMPTCGSGDCSSFCPVISLRDGGIVQHCIDAATWPHLILVCIIILSAMLVVRTG